MINIFGLRQVSVEAYFSRIGGRDAVDDADECGFAGTVRPQQSKDLSFGDLNADTIQRSVVGKAFDHLMRF